MRQRKPSTSTVLLAVLLSGVVANCWWRGPFFGLLPFLLFVLPPAALIGVLLRYSRLPRTGALVIAALATVCISWCLCAPPTTTSLFKRFLRTEMPKDIRELRRWNDNWARDPAYFMRFHASEETIESIVKAARLREKDSTRLLPPPATTGSVGTGLVETRGNLIAARVG